ncbi:MAG: mechanosensitive ion channel domain-containing protein [Bacteroidota bacterium]
MNDLDKYLEKGLGYAAEYGPKVLMAIITLLIGLWIIRAVVKLFGRALEKREVDASLKPFLGSMVSILLKTLLFISVASMVGIETTSFVAIIGAAGLAIGLALQGSLSNFAGGVLVLIFKPYRVGDLIEAQGHFGEVEEIQVFVTTVLTPDGKTVIIPNGAISNGSITNFSRKGWLRVDLVVGISYSDNIKKAKDVIMDVLNNDPNVLKDPAPGVTVLELADSSVNLAVRPFSTVENYWDVYFGTLEKVKVALDENGISIPFPQRVVHGISAS